MNKIAFAAPAALVAAGLLLASGPGFATEQAEQRRDARDVKQDTRQEARETKQEGRQTARDIKY